MEEKNVEDTEVKLKRLILESKNDELINTYIKFKIELNENFRKINAKLDIILGSKQDNLRIKKMYELLNIPMVKKCEYCGCSDGIHHKDCSFMSSL